MALLALMMLFGCVETPVLEARVTVERPNTESQPPTRPPKEERYAVRQILIQHQGCVNAPASITRSRTEAQTMARSIRQSLREGASFESLALTRSDGPEGRRGGQLGVYRVGTFDPAFESAVANVDLGEITPVVSTPFGFIIAKRDPVIRGRFAHLLISWRGQPGSTQQRDEADALKQITAFRAQLLSGAAFNALATQNSDDGRVDLGYLMPGQIGPPFDDAAFALAPGQISEVVKTHYGFHLIKRLE